MIDTPGRLEGKERKEITRGCVGNNILVWPSQLLLRARVKHTCIEACAGVLKPRQRGEHRRWHGDGGCEGVVGEGGGVDLEERLHLR